MIQNVYIQCPNMPKETRIFIRIDATLKAQLAAAAEVTGVETSSVFVRSAVRDKIAAVRQQHPEAFKEAMKAKARPSGLKLSNQKARLPESGKSDSKVGGKKR